ncbi:hypothetical protein V8F33_009735 [Rhypophila sp. PSN 637]
MCHPRFPAALIGPSGRSPYRLLHLQVERSVCPGPLDVTVVFSSCQFQKDAPEVEIVKDGTDEEAIEKEKATLSEKDEADTVVGYREPFFWVRRHMPDIEMHLSIHCRDIGSPALDTETTFLTKNPPITDLDELDLRFSVFQGSSRTTEYRPASAQRTILVGINLVEITHSNLTISKATVHSSTGGINPSGHPLQRHFFMPIEEH